MSNRLMQRLYYLAVETRSDLPPNQLLNMLGGSWSQILRAGAEHGLAGSVAYLPGTSIDQLSQLYTKGAESGATPDAQEFRSALAGLIHEKLCASSDHSAIDKIRLTAKLSSWYEGKESMNGDGELAMDAVIETPPFFKTGFMPLDRICGKDGVPQGVVTMMSLPGVGKSTVAWSIAHAWKELLPHAPVVYIQNEMAASVMAMKRDQQKRPSVTWNPELDRMVFGRRGTEQALLRLADDPDPDRLIIVDSVTGYAGSGDGPESRTKFADLYDMMVQAKNASRWVLALTHIKRGEEKITIESAAGSASIERFSDVILWMKKDEIARPDGLGIIEIGEVKQRFDGGVRPFRFAYDYIKGLAYEEDYDDEYEGLS